jgi:uncharacterized cysteine cluster protein YcgN (CxxCxxCC family)
MEDIKCNRCGKCCTLWIDGKHTTIPCKHLIRLKNGKTLCRVFNKRINRDIGNNNRCFNREDTNYLIEGCPYNDLIKEKFGEKAVDLR